MIECLDQLKSLQLQILWDQKNATIEEALHQLEQLPVKLAVILDNQGSILATITDGDIRRALLAKKALALTQ